MTHSNIAIWLEGIGLGQLARLFGEQQIEAQDLPELSERDLEKLGIPLGPRKRLMKAIAALGSSATATQPDEAADNPSPALVTEAERRQLTVMFCDLVGSTALASRLDPEELRDLMQAYQRACRDVIEKYDGHVAQYLGDGLMVYFGWPRAHEDDAVRAIRAGLEVTEAISKLASSTPLRARVGIHTGLVVVGETGQGDASVPKAAVGETPNIAARLQALAEPGDVVVSERTRSLAGGLFDYTDLGAQVLKGVSEPMHLFKVVGARASDSRFDAAHGEVALTPLVGREEEVELLLRRWAQAKAGEGQVVLVCGEPGIGKSRITQALRERIAAESTTRLRYQCSPFHTHSALHPVIEQFERAAGFAREDTPEQKLDKMDALLGEAAEGKSVAPLFAALLSLPAERYPPLNLSPPKQKEKTLEALSAQIEALSAKRPVLMLLEDAHWVDPTTQEAFELTVSRLTQHRILLVITYRPEYVAPWVGQPNVTSLTLNRLNRRKGTDLVAKLIGGRTLPQEVLDQILTHTDGVPLFLEELTKSVVESGLMRDLGDHYVLDAPLPALAIPTTLRDSLLARLDRLAPIREIAQIGACIGREFSYELLIAVSPLKGVGLDEALEQLTKTGLVSRRGMPPDAIYIFKHALVQDAAYDSLLKSRRAQLHAQIAKVLEKDFSDTVANEPELLAHHFTQAGLTKQAISYWHLAAKRAGERLAYAEAIAYFQRGIELAGTLPDAPDVAALELGLQIGLGFAYTPTEGNTAPESLRAFTRAQALCEQVGETGLPLFSALMGLFVFNLVRGELRSAHEFAERCFVLAERSGSSDMLVRAYAARAFSAYRLGHFASARIDFEKSIASYSVAAHGQLGSFYVELHDPKVEALMWLAPTLWALGYPDQAVTCCAKIEAAAMEMSHPISQCAALNASCHVQQLRGEPETTEKYADALIALAADQGFTFWGMIGVAYRAYSVIQQGKGGSRELAQLQGAIDSLRATDALEPALYFHAFLPQCYLHLADTHAALNASQEGLRLTRQQAQGRLEAHFLRSLGDALLALSNGNDIEAENFYRESIELARRQEAKSLELQAALALARLWSGQGKRKPALELLEPVYDWFTEGRSTKDHLKAAALLAELR